MGGELGELALEALRGQRARIAGDRERCAGCAGPDLADGCGSWGCGEHMFDIRKSAGQNRVQLRGLRGTPQPRIPRRSLVLRRFRGTALAEKLADRQPPERRAHDRRGRRLAGLLLGWIGAWRRETPTARPHRVGPEPTPGPTVPGEHPPRCPVENGGPVEPAMRRPRRSAIAPLWRTPASSPGGPSPFRANVREDPLAPAAAVDDPDYVVDPHLSRTGVDLPAPPARERQRAWREVTVPLIDRCPEAARITTQPLARHSQPPERSRVALPQDLGVHRTTR